MKTLYEVMNVHSANEYTKARKSHKRKMELEKDLFDLVMEAIDELDIPEDDERHYWIR